MPFVDLPEHQLRSYYLLNPLTTPPFPSSSASPDVESLPLDPSKPTLLLLHGGCRSLSHFRYQLEDERLRAAFNLLAIAARYHDRTECYESYVPPDGVHTLQNAADGILATLDALQINNYSIYAESSAGCYIAALLAIQRSAQVERLMLGSPGRIEETPDFQEDLEMLITALSVNKDGNGDQTGTIPDNVLVENGVYCFGDTTRDLLKQTEHNQAFQSRYGTGCTSIEVTHCLRAEANRSPLSAESRALITQPVLILVGGEDDLGSPQSGADSWVVGLPNVEGGARMQVISSAPHLISFIVPNFLNRLLLSFFTEPAESQIDFKDFQNVAPVELVPSLPVVAPELQSAPYISCSVVVSSA